MFILSVLFALTIGQEPTNALLANGPFAIDPLCVGNPTKLSAMQTRDCLEQIPGSAGADGFTPNSGAAFAERMRQSREITSGVCARATIGRKSLAAYETPIDADPSLSDGIAKRKSDLGRTVATLENACADRKHQDDLDKAYWNALQSIREQLEAREAYLRSQPSEKGADAALAFCTSYLERAAIAKNDGMVMPESTHVEGRMACKSPGEWSRQYGPDRPTPTPAHLFNR